MKFTQHEILEVKKHIASGKIPIKFDQNKDNNISLCFIKDVKFEIEKVNNLFNLSFINSNGSRIPKYNIGLDPVLNFLRDWINSIKKDNPIIIERVSHITKISSRFYDIFEEAITINYLGFEESSGMIFRKALEMLVKDFFIYLIPNYEDLIKNKTIGNIVPYFYEYKKESNNLEPRDKNKHDDFSSIKNELEEIKSLAKCINNTFKIGNDFSHYESRLEGYNSNDMKKNIEKIIEYINNRFDIITMNKKNDDLNSEFENQH